VCAREAEARLAQHVPEEREMAGEWTAPKVHGWVNDAAPGKWFWPDGISFLAES
jgi:hypothetical protein